jgi:hypothetical protein
MPRRWRSLASFGYHPAAGSQLPTGFVHRMAPRIPQEQYGRLITVDLHMAFVGTVGIHNQATVKAGPQGVGARWYPAQVQVNTASGAGDGSTCTIYHMMVNPTQQLAQTIQGGQDTMGISVPGMQPGDLLIAQWEGANAGDQVTMIVIGDQDVVTT